MPSSCGYLLRPPPPPPVCLCLSVWLCAADMATLSQSTSTSTLTYFPRSCSFSFSLCLINPLQVTVCRLGCDTETLNTSSIMQPPHRMLSEGTNSTRCVGGYNDGLLESKFFFLRGVVYWLGSLEQILHDACRP